MKKYLDKCHKLHCKHNFWAGAAVAGFICSVVVLCLPYDYVCLIVGIIYTFTVFLAIIYPYRAKHVLQQIIKIRRYRRYNIWAVYLQKSDVATAMQQYGGSFIQSLGAALSHADGHNARRIRNTWPAEWDKYLKMSKNKQNAHRA